MVLKVILVALVGTASLAAAAMGLVALFSAATVQNVVEDITGSVKAVSSGMSISESDYEEARKMTDSVYINAFTDQQQYVCHFIEENLGNLSTLIALYKPFNNRALIDPRDPSSIDYYDMVLNGLEEKLPDNPHTIHFKNTTEHLRSALARQQENE